MEGRVLGRLTPAPMQGPGNAGRRPGPAEAEWKSKNRHDAIVFGKVSNRFGKARA
jgi:hypothetical protein